MKGIILAGGAGTRLYPITKAISKQLIPVYDKPMIYYPLSVLMLAGINEILIISTPQDLPYFQKLLEDGSEIGLNICYEIQPNPEGLAQAFIIGEEFIGTDDVCLILGDNIFYGSGFTSLLLNAIKNTSLNKSTIFGYYVNDPHRFGIAGFDSDGNLTSIQEKPKKPKSNYAVVGLYFYTNDVIQIAKNVKPSERGELEITSLNQFYLNEDRLKIELLGRGFIWLDTGTHDSLLEASTLIESIESSNGLKIACLEEIAFKMNYINADQLEKLAISLNKSKYGQYLLNLVKNI
jgi:glucose-1-phosphate thymidylyltransferase